MRIAHIDRQRGWTGQTQQTLNCVVGLRRRGIDAELIAHRDGELARRAREAGVPTLELPLYGSASYASVLRIWRHCRANRVDVLHCHGPRDHLLAVMARMTGGVRRLVRTRHFHRELNSGFFSRLLYVPCARIVAISEFVSELCRRDKLPSDKVTVIHDAIDPRKFDQVQPDPQLRRQLSEVGDPFVIGHVSTLDLRKGTDLLIKAVAELKSKLDRPVRLVLVGPGADRWTDLVAELQLADDVIFTGQRPDVPQLLVCFDVFCMPSRAEAMGVAVLEAMAAGLPIVASKVGGLMESVTPDVGLLVEVDSVESLRQALAELAVDPQRRAKMGQAARRRAVEVFSIDAMAQQHMDLYQQICDAR